MSIETVFDENTDFGKAESSVSRTFCLAGFEMMAIIWACREPYPIRHNDLSSHSMAPQTR
jgi:hypothetical protein